MEQSDLVLGMDFSRPRCIGQQQSSINNHESLSCTIVVKRFWLGERSNTDT